MDFMNRPYEFSEIMEQCKASGSTIVEGVVSLSLTDVIDRDLEEFLDLLSDKLVGDTCLMDIQYEVVGLTKNKDVLVKVSGDADYLVNEEDWAEAV